MRSLIRAIPALCAMLAPILVACSDNGGAFPPPVENNPGSGGAGGSDAPGAGGTAAPGSGGSATGTAGDVTGMGGSTGIGGSVGAGGAGGAGGGAIIGAFSRPKGTIPSKAYPATMINATNADCKANWQKGILSPVAIEASPQPRAEDGHHNQPAVLNGYLHLNGNSGFSIYDIADPTAPKRLSHFISPNDCKDCGPKKEGEAESHTAAYARYGDTFYTATISGVGIDLWNVTDPTKPLLMKAMKLDCGMPTATPNCVNFGDFTEAVWGIYWQGTTIYVGGTSTGIHVIDAKDPANPVVVKRIPTSAFGGVNAGPIYAIGNILTVVTPKENSGLATLDISDPLNPITLAAFKTLQTSYIGQFYRPFIFEVSSSGPLRAWDVLTDPTNIGTPTTPIGTLVTQHSEYMSFSDNMMFLGHALPGTRPIRTRCRRPLTPSSPKTERRGNRSSHASASPSPTTSSWLRSAAQASSFAPWVDSLWRAHGVPRWAS